MSARPYINMRTYDGYLENATDFDARCARETTAVPSIVVLYPEVWYGLCSSRIGSDRITGLSTSASANADTDADADAADADRIADNIK
ncbi:hypothetical protein INT45_010704 [Circinella minor]|uniref:Uncharacterized protein n=1 Tax=Circinella minor TaxID=1195481 RepID=A0A8H7RS12_9FUNG|nr:hypothetical protein INT45_010704 [Circinella minor]